MRGFWLFFLLIGFFNAKEIRKSHFFGALSPKIPLSVKISNPNTLTFIKDPKIFTLKEVFSTKELFHQNIANYINQIYYSTKINFDFSEQFFVQSGKVFRQINMQRSSKRDEGKRVRLIFIGFEY